MEKSDFLNQTVNRISGYIIDITFAISTVLAPILLYLILRKSGKIGKYRWYLVYDVIWCYAFDLTITIYKPVAPEKSDNDNIDITFKIMWYTLFVIIGAILSTHLWLYAKTNGFRQFSQTTYKMQLMLLRALIMQIFLAIFFIYIPMFTIGLVMYLGSRHSGSIVTFMLAIKSAHATVDYVTMIYFVAPYRRALLQSVKRIVESKTTIIRNVDNSSVVRRSG
ncbi:serpentine type 7TM GPCR chemoreceptor sri domain-containing protein [Ditylenchus destructor]|uniref:Serpentine type 7TM GPCR chemoreceptor sri domain-containing protein n=1 Tax=Ditylenchus destructor TaxID=166010 RepID=A0AAD4QZG4_9BILA|nr:serpentine type 7TM GPCR chemoreceptor sri domain-containing protein [Ditylenchus destructor]